MCLTILILIMTMLNGSLASTNQTAIVEKWLSPINTSQVYPEAATAPPSSPQQQS